MFQRASREKVEDQIPEVIEKERDDFPQDGVSHSDICVIEFGRDLHNLGIVPGLKYAVDRLRL